jgi:hypothetical protein
VTPDGGFMIADFQNNRVRRVSPARTITTVAGSGPAGFRQESEAWRNEVDGDLGLRSVVLVEFPRRQARAW